LARADGTPPAERTFDVERIFSIRKIVSASVFVATLWGLFLSAYEWRFGLGFALGALWSILSYVGIYLIVRVWFSGNRRRVLFVILLACAKIPLLYFLLYQLFAHPAYFNHLGLVLGMSLALMVVLLKAVGAVIVYQTRK